MKALSSLCGWREPSIPSCASPGSAQPAGVSSGKMRLKSSEQVVTQEFYLPWESHGSLEQPLQCQPWEPCWAPARLLHQAGVLPKPQHSGVPGGAVQIPANCCGVAFGTAQVTPCLPSTLQSASRPAVLLPRGAAAGKGLLFPQNCLTLTMTARLSQETFALI